MPKEAWSERERKQENNAHCDEGYAAWVGFDWGDQEHVWSLQWTDTGERERGRLEQTPEALDVWIGQLMSRLDGRRIGIAIEQKHGAVVWMLLKYECVEIYPIHPQAAGQFRQALYPSGSKSDPADGELRLELLVHHRNRLRPLEQDDEPTRRLLMLVEQRRHWVEEKKRHGNRLSARLKVYFPQVLNWFDDIGAAPVLDLLARWPKLEQLQKAQRKTLEAFLRQHRRTSEEAAAWDSRWQRDGCSEPSIAARAQVHQREAWHTPPTLAGTMYARRRRRPSSAPVADMFRKTRACFVEKPPAIQR